MPDARTWTALLFAVALVAQVAGQPVGPRRPSPEDTGITGEATGAALEVLGTAGAGAKIDAIVSPLASVPAIVEDGARLTVELDPARLEAVPPAQAFRARLVPSFGAAKAPAELTPRNVAARAPSEVWPDRTVVRVTFDVPPLGSSGDYVEDLYDLRIRGPVRDTQPRAVQVVDAHPDDPRFVVIADPQVGDPRAMQDGAEDSYDERSPEPFLKSVERTFGHGTDRWKAFRKVIREVNLLDPDFVLVAGDITFGQDLPGKYHAEYEDAYRLLNTIRAPTYVAMGNHDGYVQSGEDGQAFWRAYFGPLHYSIDVGDGLHIASINTYDWSELDRFGVMYGVSAWGGQVRSDQLDWLRDDLTTWRADHPDGTLITFAHHDPSWVQDEAPPPFDRTRGIPVAEQVGRGAGTFLTTGQGWSGQHRLALRDLLAEADVAYHFAGHIHKDRIARYHQGHVAETAQKTDQGDPTELRYVLRNGTLGDGWTSARLESMVRNASHGPLFVDTTTAASDTEGYWGWRLVDLGGPQPGAGLPRLGYPADRAFLDRHARHPGIWNASMADLGLFSHPSWRFNATVNGSLDGSGDRVQVTLRSDLAADLQTVVPLSLRDGSVEVRVDGQPVDPVRRRSHGGSQDLWVPVDVPAGAERTVTARVVG